MSHLQHHSFLVTLLFPVFFVAPFLRHFLSHFPSLHLFLILFTTLFLLFTFYLHLSFCFIFLVFLSFFYYLFLTLPFSLPHRVFFSHPFTYVFSSYFLLMYSVAHFPASCALLPYFIHPVSPSHALPHPFAPWRTLFLSLRPCPAQLFTYSSMSPVSAMSGVISPTSMSLFTSPGSTPRTTPRSTPPAVPRWNTPFISLDENMDYTTMSTLMPTLPADATSAQLIEDGMWAYGCRCGW